MYLYNHFICEYRNIFYNVFPLKKSSINTEIQLDEYVSSSNAYNRDVLNDYVEPERSKRQKDCY